MSRHDRYHMQQEVVVSCVRDTRRILVPGESVTYHDEDAQLCPSLFKLTCSSLRAYNYVASDKHARSGATSRDEFVRCLHCAPSHHS